MKTVYKKKRKAIREYRMFELKWMLIHLKRIPLKITSDFLGIANQLQTF